MAVPTPAVRVTRARFLAMTATTATQLATLAAPPRRVAPSVPRRARAPASFRRPGRTPRAASSSSARDRDGSELDAPPVPRRGVLIAATAAAAAAAAASTLPPRAVASPASTPADVTVVVAKDGRSPDGIEGRAYASISDAVAAALDAAAALGKVNVACVRIAPGTYAERVVVPAFAAQCDALRIEPLDPGDDRASGRVVIEHFTSVPYEAVVEVAPNAKGLVLENLTIRHGSKSVANNYAVFANVGSGLTMRGCDVSSDTGSGIAAEGAYLDLTDCVVSNCKTHGVAVYGDLFGNGGFGRVNKCVIRDNGEDGVLVRGGAVAEIAGNEVYGNGRFGVELADVGADCRVVDNAVGVGRKGRRGVVVDDAVSDVEVSGNRERL